MSIVSAEKSTPVDDSPWQTTPGFPPTQGPIQEDDSPWQTTPGFPSIKGPHRDPQSAEDDEQIEIPPFGNQVGNTEESIDQQNDQCTELGIKNVSASGFESDPADYHPLLL